VKIGKILRYWEVCIEGMILEGLFIEFIWVLLKWEIIRIRSIKK
jgi:hypothetical protein